ncbi:hypothetical protein B9Z19DRAFT_1034345 [Tuber borchii]|uniref:Uncharacterized protein n=1 Tax=Tuber borchii TaxID=42251 RepID=A0A2T6ZDY9_TUBBO|nr:hypothetical protein B9Z19DRAFT_1034345 [Tuber borchii]
MASKFPPTPLADISALRRYALISHAETYNRTSNLLSQTQESHLSQRTEYEASLVQATTELRRRLMDEEMALSELSSQITIPDDTTSQESPHRKLRRLKAEKEAYNLGFQTIDYLPGRDSPLNILLAYRNVARVIEQTKVAIPIVNERLRSVQAQIKAEEGNLKEQNKLTGALRKRIEELEEEEQRIEVGVVHGDAIKAMDKKRKELLKRTSKLLRELLGFLKDGGLARMLAAEDMGGPVVGEDLEVTLETGFDKRGKARKGERRIDEMWGQGEVGLEESMVEEFKALLEELMNASLETTQYVNLKKDGAAARFLVRAKVAVYHPKDARKLKLLDFGSTVEDG